MNTQSALIHYPSNLFDEEEYNRTDVASFVVALCSIASHCSSAARNLHDAIDDLEHHHTNKDAINVDMKIDELESPIRDAIRALEKAETLFYRAAFDAFK
jgi:hypothetical protein